MRRCATLWILILAFVWPTTALANPREAIHCSDRILETEEVTPLVGSWKYHAGDDPAWADPGFDDGSWEAAPPDFTADNPPPGGWTGIGWFRIRLNVDPELQNRPLALIVIQWGASELYLDGELIHTLGRVATFEEEGVVEEVYLSHELPTVLPIQFDDGRDHLLAVRFSYHHETHFFGNRRHRMGIYMRLSSAETAISVLSHELRREAKSRTFFGSVALTFAFLHLLLFAFYPKLKSHLYYALFTALAAVIAYLPLPIKTAVDVDRMFVLFRVFHFSLIAVSVFGLKFVYSVFYKKTPPVLWVALAAGAAVGFLGRNGPMDMSLIYCLVVFVEIFRVLIVAILKRKRGAWIIAVGSAAFLLTSAYQILNGLGVVPATTETAYLWGLLFMLVCMSIALAWHHAQTNKDLEKQVIQIRELSEMAIEQERRVQEEEKKIMRLETDNALKAIELEEAHKRQKVLEQLETTNQELRKTQTQLVQSEKMASLGNLVAGVAHEINTPIGAINSMHNTMVRALDKLRAAVRKTRPDGSSPDEEVEFAFKVIDDANSVIKSGAERVTDIVKRLKSFARLDEAELKRVDLHQGLEDTLSLVHHELKHHVTVNKNYGDIPPIPCFPGQLNQVYINLLVNASQSIEGQGEITISTCREGDSVFIEFEDTGRGIPEEQLEKIFDPGFTTKGVGVGTGLGLSICYQIIQAHKGEISVKSELGKGTTFTLRIPTNLDKLIETRETRV